jgi:antitoxin CptB
VSDATPVGVPLGLVKARSRRGMKELDVLLERWIARDLPAADAATVARYMELMALQDPELARFLVNGEPHPDPELRHVIARIRTADRDRA